MTTPRFAWLTAVWVRLLVLALVPLVGIVGISAPFLNDVWAVRTGTRAAERSVAALQAVVITRSALMSEVSSTESAVRAASFGLSLEQASALFGEDLEAGIADARRTLDAAVAHLAAVLPDVAAELRPVLATGRSAFDTGAPTVDEIHSTYVRAGELLRETSERQMASAFVAAADVSGHAEGVESAVRRLSVAYELANIAQDEVDDLFRVVVPGASDAARAAAARVDLIGTRRLYDESIATLTSAGSPALAAAVEALTANEDTQAVDAFVGDVGGTGSVPISEIAGLFRSSFVRTDLHADLVELAAREAANIAATRRSDAESRLAVTIGTLACVLIVAAGLALIVARSITRRLRPLAERAAAVSNGRLEGPPTPERGPREIVVVAHALNDTVGNLRTIEGQAAALARGDLDDPVLDQPAAGALGESIHQSVERLANAWRDREALQARLTHQASHDLLTSLPNRKAAMDALEAALARAQRHGDCVTVLFIDLDEFKRANDTYGHHAGDRVLQLTATRLASIVRAGDVVARLGGDEFVMITEGLSSPRDATELGERVIAALTAPFTIDDVTTRVGASIGIGISRDGNVSAADLLRDADHAVHRAKRAGRGRVEIFDEQARDELAADRALEQALRLALERRELRLHYQPITDTTTGAVRGFEALARWTLDGTPVSPERFVTVAEQSDLVNDLGIWALEEATRQLQTWTAQGLHTDAYVAVNVSGRHLLHTGFLEHVRGALAASGLDPSRLVIEITETVILSDLPTAASVLEEVRALGIRIALDDFGTGYTSIGHLWRLPVDVLKIDGTFIRHLDDAQDHVLVQLMIDVAHTLGLGLVAEGVETVTQRRMLQTLSCDAIQGYLIARPTPPEGIAHSFGAALPS